MPRPTVRDMGKIDLPTPEQNDQIVAGDIEEMAQVVRWITRDAYVRDSWLRCVIKIDGPPETRRSASTRRAIAMKPSASW